MTRTLQLTVAVSVFLFSGVVRAALIDNFDNGVVEDSDSKLGYWGSTSFGGSANAISETSSKLTFTIGDNDGVNDNDFAGASIFSNAFDSEFNFFSSTVTIKLRGVQFASTGSPHVGAGERYLRVGFVSSGTTAFGADDAVFVRIFDTEVSVRSKTNETNLNGQGTEHARIGSINGVGGIDLQIGPSSDGMLNYSLIAYYPSGVAAGSTFGSFSYDASQWDQANQSSRLLVMAQEQNVSGGNQVFAASISSLEVSAVPEPTSLFSLAIAVIGFSWHSTRRCRNVREKRLC